MASALTAEERKIAEDILRVLSRDAAIRVRQALSEELKQSKKSAARCGGRAGARCRIGFAAGAQPFARADRRRPHRHRPRWRRRQAGGDRRPQPGIRGVAEAIVDADQPIALATLVGNDGAELTEPLLQRVLERHGADEAIQAPMAQRAHLPLTVLERLVTAASANLREILAKRTDLPAHLASELVLGTRERATATLMSPESIAAEAFALAQQLHRGGRLTSNLVVRAVCLGDLAFVEAAFAVLADIPIHNARLLIYDAGPLGFKAIYERCKLPPELLDLMRIGLRVAQQTGFDGGENDRERHSRRTLERILTQYENIGSEDLEYLLGKLRAAAGVAA